MLLRPFFLPMSLSLAFAGIAHAETHAMNLSNLSGEDVTSITIVPVETPEAQPQPVPGAAVAAGDEGAITFETPIGACVFDLAITLASGKSINRPNTDICQMDGLIIE